MKPPPPMFPADGWTAVRANCTATAASTALPPAMRICFPMADASGCAETTMAESARTPTAGALDLGDLQATTAIASKSGKMRFIIVNIGKVTIKFLIQVKVGRSMSLRKEKAARLKVQVLEHTLKLIGKKPFEDVYVEDICEKVKIS